MDDEVAKTCPVDAMKASQHRHSGGMHRSEGLRRIADSVRGELERIAVQGSVILDYGCGAGYYCRFLKKYASKLYCVDISDDALKETKAAVPDAITVNDTSGIASGSVDLILFANSFHDMNDKRKVVREVDRMLSERGWVIILDWKKNAAQTSGPPISLRMSESDYLKVFFKYGVVGRFDVPDTHFGMVISKQH